FFFSNGPGDPAAVKNGIENIKKLTELGKPVFGICLGHQMLANALGGKTFKMKFGHHGGNQPVKAAYRKQVIITAQNHGFAIDEQALTAKHPDVKGSYEMNPNDNSYEGFKLINSKQKVLSVQYHPEASPGPHDARVVFKEFKEMLRAG
ncbi:MAG: gamma-glutamyl-gamma-aminobutyrate hydrolase family protein, partial [Leptospiraceae bacterium]|nr:gamma-glutamyl-gamma-aminobutyrate hydrolase family protein [Leptospiraceae bacterium]